jgi:hypothetical protein
LEHRASSISTTTRPTTSLICCYRTHPSPHSQSSPPEHSDLPRYLIAISSHLISTRTSAAGDGRGGGQVAFSIVLPSLGTGRERGRTKGLGWSWMLTSIFVQNIRSSDSTLVDVERSDGGRRAHPSLAPLDPPPFTLSTRSTERCLVRVIQTEEDP